MRLTAAAVLRAADFAANCLRGALPGEQSEKTLEGPTLRVNSPPVDLRAVCLVRAIGKSEIYDEKRIYAVSEEGECECKLSQRGRYIYLMGRVSHVLSTTR
jgi:hypothetical protein